MTSQIILYTHKKEIILEHYGNTKTNVHGIYKRIQSTTVQIGSIELVLKTSHSNIVHSVNLAPEMDSLGV